MSLLITGESYNGDAFLSSNVGDWTTNKFEFLHRVDYFAQTQSKSIVYRNIGGIWYFELTDGSIWIDYGFVSGKSVDLVYEDHITPGIVTLTATVDYCDGEKLYFTSIPVDPAIPDGAQWPVYDETTNELSVSLTLIQADAPESVEYDFNLTTTEGGGFASVIDGSINRFKCDDIAGLVPLGSHVFMTQIGNHSGGYFGGVTIRLISLVDGYRKYLIEYSFFNWTMLQNGFNEPEWFVGVETLAPIHRVGVFSELNNPNSSLGSISENVNASLGGFDENYNTSINGFTVDNVIFKDSLGNVLSGIDYSNTTYFEAYITDTNNRLNLTYSRFNIGMMWRPIDSDEYYTNTNNFGKNCIALAPVNDFTYTALPDPTIYNGNTRDGANWKFSHLHFTIGGSSNLTVKGRIIPDVGNQAFYDALDDGEKKTTFWVSPWRIDYASNQQKRVSIKLFDADVISAPAIGDPILISNESFKDHGGYDLPTGLTTTEDDVLYTLDFGLKRNDLYQGVRAEIQMYNTLTGEFFPLESFVFGFNSVPYVGGEYQVSNSINRNFNLPPTTDRNQIKLNRLTGIDTVSYYGLRLEYGFENLWRYWELQANADNDFFDLAEPNNGLNKNWRRMNTFAYWTPRVSVYAIKDDQEDYNHTNFSIRAYDDEDVTTVLSFVDLSDLSTPSTPVANAMIEVTATMTWNVSNYDPTNWFEATVEDFEGGNRWVISNVLPQGGISTNPLKPISGAVGLDITIVANVATVKYILDTNIIDASKISLTHRVFTLPREVFGKLKEDGTPKLMEDGTQKELD